MVCTRCAWAVAPLSAGASGASSPCVSEVHEAAGLLPRAAAGGRRGAAGRVGSGGGKGSVGGGEEGALGVQLCSTTHSVGRQGHSGGWHLAEA